MMGCVCFCFWLMFFFSLEHTKLFTLSRWVIDQNPTYLFVYKILCIRIRITIVTIPINQSVYNPSDPCIWMYLIYLYHKKSTNVRIYSSRITWILRVMECHWPRPNEVQRAAANALGLRRLQDWRRCEEFLNAPWILAQSLVWGH